MYNNLLVFLPQELGHLVGSIELLSYEKLSSIVSEEEVIFYHLYNESIVKSFFGEFNSVTKLEENRLWLYGKQEQLNSVAKKYSDNMILPNDSFGLRVEPLDGHTLTCLVNPNGDKPVLSLLCEIERLYGYNKAAATQAFTNCFSKNTLF